MQSNRKYNMLFSMTFACHGDCYPFEREVINYYKSVKKKTHIILKSSRECVNCLLTAIFLLVNFQEQFSQRSNLVCPKTKTLKYWKTTTRYNRYI